MTIYFVRFNSTPFGGAENFLSRLKEELASRGIQTAAVSGGSFGEGTFAIEVPKFLPSWLRVLLFAFRACSFLSKREGVVFSLERIPCADVYRAGDGVHREWMRIKLSHESRLKRIGTFFSPLNYVYLWLERRTFENSKLIIANSQRVKRDIVKHYDIDEKKIAVVYNGVPQAPSMDAQSAKIALCEEFGINADAKVLLFVGSGFFRKGAKQFLQIFAALRVENTVAFIVGKERCIGAYRALAKKLGVADCVIFTGARRDVARFYAAADVFLFPTIYEPFSNVCLEAMAQGCAVFTTQANGASEILDGQYVIKADETAETTAATIDALLSDEKSLSAAKSQNIETAAKLSISRNADETLKLLETISPKR